MSEQTVEEYFCRFIEGIIEAIKLIPRIKGSGWVDLHAPYLFKRLRDGRWVALNRAYKPLGLPRETWLDYEEFTGEAIEFSGDPHKFVDIWTADQGDRLFLYDDGAETKKDYVKRLIALAGRLRDPHIA